jgi:hypothetical protein
MVAGVMPETYQWTKDSEVTAIGHPDATSTTVTRDMARRATRVASPWATTTFDFSPMTGQVVALTRGTQRLDWRYDGMCSEARCSAGSA